jgi:hypothetical protein
MCLLAEEVDESRAHVPPVLRRVVTIEGPPRGGTRLKESRSPVPSRVRPPRLPPGTTRPAAPLRTKCPYEVPDTFLGPLGPVQRSQENSVPRVYWRTATSPRSLAPRKHLHEVCVSVSAVRGGLRHRPHALHHGAGRDRRQGPLVGSARRRDAHGRHLHPHRLAPGRGGCASQAPPEPRCATR